jgi:hypothetical protein
MAQYAEVLRLIAFCRAVQSTKLALYSGWSGATREAVSLAIDAHRTPEHPKYFYQFISKKKANFIFQVVIDAKDFPERDILLRDHLKIDWANWDIFSWL